MSELDVIGSPEPEKSPTSSVSLPIPESVFEEYVEASLTGWQTGTQLQFEVQENLAPMIQCVAATEGPVHIDLIIERIRERYGLGHVRGGTRDHVESAIERAARDRVVFKEGDFIWSADDQLHRPPRRPPEGATPRNIDHISQYELEPAVLATVKAMFGGRREEIISQTARNLGFQRTGSKITEVLDGTVQRLLEGGKLIESFGMLRALDS